MNKCEEKTSTSHFPMWLIPPDVTWLILTSITSSPSSSWLFDHLVPVFLVVLLAKGLLKNSERCLTVFCACTRGDGGLLCFPPCNAAAEAADEKSAALSPPQRRWEMLLKMKFTLLLISPSDAAFRLSRAFWRRFVYPACLPRCLPSTPLRGALQSSPGECQSN